MGMDSILPEWYRHDDEALATIVTTGTIALDANVMLELYRVGESLATASSFRIKQRSSTKRTGSSSPAELTRSSLHSPRNWS
ncbi:MAG: hypothetical protein QOJ80_2856 [Mycobacterium sp.]|jgi:hypothetical protein|nr:hypothetical protein [Mycobacterium sp.]